MRIYIPSMGRADKQPFLDSLPNVIKRDAELVVPDKEVTVYDKCRYGVDILGHPTKLKGIAAKRQWIIDQHSVDAYGPNIVMVDDDIKFDTRRVDDPGKFLGATGYDIAEIFDNLDRHLSLDVAHVGVLGREGGNRVQDTLIMNSRMMRVLGYNVDVLRKEKIRFDRVELMEDFDVNLQLLRKGYPSVILCDWVQGQSGSNAAGGCSGYRTPEMQKRSALKLAELHPGFVKVVQKETKGGWFGEPRYDVTVQWKKAYESSKS